MNAVRETDKGVKVGDLVLVADGYGLITNIQTQLGSYYLNYDLVADKEFQPSKRRGIIVDCLSDRAKITVLGAKALGDAFWAAFDAEVKRAQDRMENLNDTSLRLQQLIGVSDG